jgi:hypothetical protein
MRSDRRRHQVTVVAPAKEPVARPGIGAPGVRVADVCSEEFDIAPGGFVAEIGNQRRHDIERTQVRREVGRCDDRRKLIF